MVSYDNGPRPRSDGGCLFRTSLARDFVRVEILLILSGQRFYQIKMDPYSDTLWAFDVDADRSASVTEGARQETRATKNYSIIVAPFVYLFLIQFFSY